MKRISHIIFLSFFLFSTLALSGETVKAGYVVYQGYQEGGENEYKTGFGYEYLQKLSYYAGWDFEYVYGSFNELLEKLKNGEIDIMGNVSYTPERAKDMYFSEEEQGSETYYFYTLLKNANLVRYDKQILNGKRIGINAGSYQLDLFKEWCKKNNIDCSIIEYENDILRYEDLNSGYLFGIIESTIVGKSDLSNQWTPVFTVGYSPFYFAVSKTRPDILEILNEAQEKILLFNRFYNEEVKIKYLKGREIVAPNLDTEEYEWIIRNPCLQVGYVLDYAPFCNVDSTTGELVGLVKSVLDNISQKFEISYNAVPYNSYEDMLKALHAGKIDVIVPILGDFWIAENEGISLTDPITTSNMLLFFSGTYSKNVTEKLAVTKSSPFSVHYAKIFFPDSELVYCDTIWDCIEAAKRDDTVSTVFNASCYHVDKNIHDDFDSLQITLLNDSIDICFAVDKKNTHLLSFLNKGLTATPKSLITDALVEASFVKEVLSLKSLIKNHPKTIFILTFGFLTLILFFFLGYIVVTRRSQKKLSILREQAEFANSAKTTFLFNMSHDIRTPMNAVVGFTEMAQRNITDTAKVKDYLQKIKVSSDTLLSLINQVLDLARIESNKIQVNYSVVNLLTFEEIIRSMFENAASANDIKLIVETDIQDEYFYLDQTMMTQICVNLIGNAIKFTSAGGTITHSVKQLSKPDILGNVKIQVKIKDTGIGMSEEYLKKAFEAFTRERTSTESGIQGTGLGLSIVKRTCELLGADLKVESEVGKGTEFTIIYSLKIASKPENSKNRTKKSIKQKNLEGKKVLLVEDNKLNQQIATEILKSIGLEVDVADNGAIAVENASTKDYDLILMDIQMPIMNGYVSTNHIRRLSEVKKATVPIIAMTANAFEDDKKRALKEGMNGFVSKPIDITELLKSINEHIR